MQEALQMSVLMLAPIVPHIAHALWQALGQATAVLDARWPEVDESALARDTIDLVVQVNGKLRGHIAVPAGADKAAIEEAALADAAVQRFLEGQPIKRLIVVPGRLVNIVV
ncbi:MAG: class I tRNA ligase family protein, partial [Halothiobacillaceae bacterium]|jgi:leucyl-tRNA synthetase|nr:class I tRNA ligase family protein [Halothiobacillaceae bacterium]